MYLDNGHGEPGPLSAPKNTWGLPQLTTSSVVMDVGARCGAAPTAAGRRSGLVELFQKYTEI